MKEAPQDTLPLGGEQKNFFTQTWQLANWPLFFRNRLAVIVVGTSIAKLAHMCLAQTGRFRLSEVQKLEAWVVWSSSGQRCHIVIQFEPTTMFQGMSMLLNGTNHKVIT